MHIGVNVYHEAVCDKRRFARRIGKRRFRIVLLEKKEKVKYNKGMGQEVNAKIVELA